MPICYHPSIEYRWNETNTDDIPVESNRCNTSFSGERTKRRIEVIDALARGGVSVNQYYDTYGARDIHRAAGTSDVSLNIHSRDYEAGCVLEVGDRVVWDAAHLCSLFFRWAPNVRRCVVCLPWC